jgi:tryptophan-rich sensory protein
MNYKKLFLIILVTFLIATVPSMFISSNIDYLNKPFAIPNIIFPIVWTILYLLMSIAYYLVSDHQKTLPIYLSQLIFNSLWTIIFFGLKLRLLAFIWLILLLLQVIYMTSMYFKINKTTLYLLLPYIIWLIFAGYLNLSIYLLNV